MLFLGLLLLLLLGLVEERMVCLGQQHSENKAIVVATAVVKDLTIYGWDDSSTRDCTCCWRGHNCSGVADFAIEIEEVYCRYLQHKLQAIQLLQIAEQKHKGLCGGRQRSINHRV